MKRENDKYHMNLLLSPEEKQMLLDVMDYYGLRRISDQIRFLIRKAYREISSEVKTAA